jgi:hypothetical protein
LIAAAALFPLRAGSPRSIRRRQTDSTQEATMNIFWKKTVTSGSFTSAANWVQGVIPGANDVAELTTSGATVTDNGTAITVLGLNLVSTGILAVNGDLTATEGTAAGANRGTIDILPAGALTVGGNFDNIGGINVSTNASLNFQSFDATLKGSGTVSLNFHSHINLQNSTKLTNVDNTIEGTGSIQGSSVLINQRNGVINANSDQALGLFVPITNSVYSKRQGQTETW